VEVTKALLLGVALKDGDDDGNTSLVLGALLPAVRLGLFGSVWVCLLSFRDVHLCIDLCFSLFVVVVVVVVAAAPCFFHHHHKTGTCE